MGEIIESFDDVILVGVFNEVGIFGLILKRFLKLKSVYIYTYLNPSRDQRRW